MGRDQDKRKAGRTEGFLSPLSRRSFLKASAVLASAAGGASVFLRADRVHASVRTGQSDPDRVETEPDVHVLYSVCLMCHSACGVRAKVKDGTLLKLDGNPYHPNGTTFEERVPYDTDPQGSVIAPGAADQGHANDGKDVKLVAGSICPKGQAGIEQLYNPFRVKQPLRRVGPRGSNEWAAVSWDEALNEIAGLRTSPLGLTNLAQARDFSTNAGEFDDFGPAVNRIVSSVGRMEHGNKECNDRFFGTGLKSVNKRLDHTSICEASHHVSGQLLGEKHLKPDVLGCTYLVAFGTNPLEAGFPMVPFARKLMEFKKQGGTLVVIDPRHTPSASKADLWIAPRPGADAAIAWGMIRTILESSLYDETFLTNANEAAAEEDYSGSSTHSDAVWLVRRDSGKYLRGDEGGLGGSPDEYVCLVNGVPTPFDPAGAAVDGDLFAFGVDVGGVVCDSAFQLVYDRAMENSVGGWAAIADVDEGDVRSVATAFAAAAPRSAATFYRGSVQHPNGTYTGMSLHYLNLLVGNLDRIGGVSKGGGHWHEDGSKSGQLPMSENANTNDLPDAAPSASGVKLNRAGSQYFGSDEHARHGYDPAGGHPKRPWFPQALHGNWQEVAPSIDDGYPYSCSVLFLYAGNPVYSAPAARADAARIFGDTSKIGLFVSIDVEINETNVFADYILPDTTYLEKWSTPHLAPTILTKGSGVRQPVVGEVWDGTKYVDIASLDRLTAIQLLNAASGSGNNFAWSKNPYYRPVLPDARLPEDIYCDLARRVGQALGIPGGWLPGFGPNAFETADDTTGSTALRTAWDWHRRLGVNVGRGDSFPGSEVPGGSDMERLAYVHSRGGRFADGDGYDAGWLASKINGRFSFYSEGLATTMRSDREEAFDGLGRYEEPFVDWRGEPLYDGEYPFQIVTWKPVQHTQSRTALAPTLMALWPENFVWINDRDASGLGIATGDKVRLLSPSGPSEGVEGKAMVTETIRRGVVGVSNSFGHWQLHSVPPTIDGRPDGFDEKRGRGIQANPILRVDPKLGNVCLQDPVGGSASFYDTRVKLKKI